ncbi:hypothetical protein CCP4SC76_5320005 [Gammaproteobacteria bacterium]
MVRFLWIEDFENDKNSVVEQVFGNYLKTLDIQNAPYPQEWREVLERANICLKENFLDGYRFLEDPEKLRKVDFVVLDIDLRLADPDDEADNPATQVALADIQQQEFGDDSREKMKEKAGFLLFRCMIVNHRFPRERILICSDHGSNIKGRIPDFPSFLMRGLPYRPSRSGVHEIRFRVG